MLKIKNHKAELIPLFFLLVYTHECHAYIDPGTGSLILQSIIATVAVVLATGKMWWHRVIAFFGRKDDKDTDDQSETGGFEDDN